MERVYSEVKKERPGENGFVKRLYEAEWLKSDQRAIRKHLHTQYKEVEKIQSGLAIKW